MNRRRRKDTIMVASQRHEAAIELGYVSAGYRRRRKATRTLDALSLAWLRNERQSLETVRLMSHGSDNDGRSQADTDPNLVNGTEVRFSERWLMPSDPTIDYDAVVSIMPDGSRKPFTAHLDAIHDDEPTRAETDRAHAIALELIALAADERGARRRK
jgi:hypothetical protein